MTSQFDALNELILADMRRDYTETTIDHSMNPRNLGVTVLETMKS